jgi:glycosyltransferase involved in cell wall biosynthesis
MTMRSLYISHGGMTEPLGRAQILPYLFGLSAHGADIEVLSYEPEGTSQASLDATRSLLASHGLAWLPQVRSPKHDLATKLFESTRGVATGLIRALRRRPHVVHARSHMPAAIADVIATITPRAKLLFDCRGMIGDEYVDAGAWTTDRREYKMLKRVERRLFDRAEGMVVLTNALAKWLRAENVLGANTNLAVIPCCVDMARFTASAAVREKARASLGIQEDELAVLYSGTLGSWYLESEMARFATEVKKLRQKTKFVVLSRADATSLRTLLVHAGFHESDVIQRSVSPDAMPETLPAGDIGLSFIQSCFSKKGSSPTKVAEYLAAGMPVVVNGDIGDQAELRAERNACTVVSGYSEDELRAAAASALTHAHAPFQLRQEATRAAAERHFSLSAIGIPRYVALYENLART